MLKISTPLQPLASGSRAPPPAGFALSSLSAGSSAETSPALDSPPINSFAKRYRATPLPTPMNESLPVTPLSSVGASTPGTEPGSDAVEDEDFEADGEVTLVKRNTGKGYRYQRKGEVLDGQSSTGGTKERRSSSSSSAEERKRASAAEKVEQSRIKVRAARLAEQEQKEREEHELRRQQEEDQGVDSDELAASGRRRSADPVISYAQQMQDHMLHLMKGMEKVEVTPGFVRRETNKDE